MGRIPWTTQEPGHCEVDLVHHSGESTAGEYLHTLQLIDVATGWSERVAVLGRSGRAMEVGFRQILSRVPFAIHELHPDNGSEFFNQHLVRFWGEQITGLTLSRSRPYQKNDNRMVEQKNDSLMRQYFGHLRLDTQAQLQAMNALYEQMWVYYNLFQPVLHLCEKTVVNNKVHRVWDEAQTPYQRVLATGMMSQERQERLQQLYLRSNPYLLRKRIYQAIEALWQEQLSDAREAAVTFSFEGTVFTHGFSVTFSFELTRMLIPRLLPPNKEWTIHPCHAMDRAFWSSIL